MAKLLDEIAGPLVIRTAEKVAEKHGLQFTSYLAWRDFMNCRGGQYEVMDDRSGQRRFIDYVRVGVEWTKQNRAREAQP